MNILHVCSNIDPAAGGTATVVLGLLRAQAKAGLKPRLVMTYPQACSPDFANRLESIGIPVDVIGPCGGKLNRHPAICPTLRKAMQMADIVHIHSVWEQIQHDAATQARKTGVPYIITPHGMLDPWSLRQGKWKKRLYLAWRLRRNLNGAAALHFTADVERDLTLPLKLKPQAIVEPNGIDLDEFNCLPARGTFRSKYPEIGNRPFVLFLSRLHPKKGLDVLIPAFAMGAPKETALVLAGPCSKEYRAELELLTQKYGINDRVIWTGMLNGPQRIEAYVDATVFCLPSYQENFGIVVIEALAAGTPVLISDQVNIWQAIVSSHVGGVSPVAVGPLSHEIKEWLLNDSRRHAAAESAQNFVAARYNWNTIAANWARYYRNISAGD